MTELPESAEDALERMASGLIPLCDSRTVMIGVHTGGVWIARRLHPMLGLQAPLGTIDITFYRDDFSTVGLHPQVRTSDIPVDIEDRDVLLVDDVIHTGRTVRAALNEIFSYGRPRTVRLATLVDRGGRELPIQPDVVGLTIDLGPDRQVKLTGPDEMRLVLGSNPRAG
jgi:pyrimidine operon attenuation protein/uracil phosphoribosyltransferase